MAATKGSKAARSASQWVRSQAPAKVPGAPPRVTTRASGQNSRFSRQ